MRALKVSLEGGVQCCCVLRCVLGPGTGQFQSSSFHGWSCEFMCELADYISTADTERKFLTYRYCKRPPSVVFAGADF